MFLCFQLSIDAQKIEERTMRQCILRPLTPSSNKISVSTLSIAFVPMNALGFIICVFMALHGCYKLITLFLSCLIIIMTF